MPPNFNEIQLTYNTKTINLHLADQRGISDEVIVAIDIIHSKLAEVLGHPESVQLGETDSIVDVVRAYEFVLQQLWGFPCDSNYHTYQNYIIGCLCPKLDNKDMIGTKYRHVNNGCPYHGEKA
jgi:hypothetical protein